MGSTTNLNFAPAEPTQHDAIYQLMRDAFTPYVKALDRGARSGPYPWLEESIRNGEVYVGLDGSEILGVVSTLRRNDELIIGQLGVAPARQGEGIGSWILKQVERTARREKVKVISLQTAEMMTGQLRLYARHGFQITRKSLPKHGEDEHLRVHMIKRL